MKLHDGGMRLASRIAALEASLQSHVAQLRALLPTAPGAVAEALPRPGPGPDASSKSGNQAPAVPPEQPSAGPATAKPAPASLEPKDQSSQVSPTGSLCPGTSAAGIADACKRAAAAQCATSIL